MSADNPTVILYAASCPEGRQPGQAARTGIYSYQLNLQTGAMNPVGTVPNLPNALFYASDPTNRHLYVVHRDDEAADGAPNGYITAYSIDGATGQLTAINTEATDGNEPCHLSVDQTGQYVFLVNYMGPTGPGNLSVRRIAPNGGLAGETACIQHVGSSVNAARQECSHPHMVLPDPTNQLVLIPDLGTDRVAVYRIDLADGSLAHHDPPWLQLAPGAGPRHLTFHPNGKTLYVINELNSTITAFTYDSTAGTFSEIQTISTLPDDFTGESYCAAIHITPSGKFLYGSNRGHDSIAIFAVDDLSGQLTPVGYEPTRGSWPRGFSIDPTGQYLIVGNQRGDNLVTFRINPDTGELTATGHEVSIPTPAHVEPVALPG